MTDDITTSKSIATPTTPKKINVVGLDYFGERFIYFQKIEEYRDLIPAFKDMYYAEKKTNPGCTMKSILRKFNLEVCAPLNRNFHPYLTNTKLWRTKWDRDIASQLQAEGATELAKREVQQVIKTRNEDGRLDLGAVSDGALEAGARTLGGELLNDAMQMLKDDQDLEEVYTDEVLIKRRAYIVNVFGHVTKLVHGKAALLLKASQEKRENASFLMTLLAKASSGKLTDEEMGMLNTTYAPKKTEEPVSV